MSKLLDQRNIFLTGPSRSGTTMACVLLNKVSDMVAIHEPFNVDSFGQKNWQEKASFCSRIEEFITASRASLLSDGTVVSRQFEGAITSNPAANEYPTKTTVIMDKMRSSLNLWRKQSGHKRLDLRKIVHSQNTIKVGKTLSEDFNLAIKHNMVFTSLLEQLVPASPCYAIIRNPLSTLASWNTVNFGLSHGRLPFWFDTWEKEAYRFIMSSDDILERQVRLLEWFLERYEKHLDPSNIITYESIIASGGAVLSAIDQKASTLNEQLENKNNNPLYPNNVLEKIAGKILKRESVIWSFYKKEDVEIIMEMRNC